MFVLKNNKTDTKNVTAYSPVIGEEIETCDIKDEMFRKEMLGKTYAFSSKDGVVCSPFDGKVKMLFPTKHAIGIVAENGVEILIHIGIDTVNLNGKYFDSFVKQGSKVKKGDVLVRFDLENVVSSGYDATVMLAVTNHTDYEISGPEKSAKSINLNDVLFEAARA